MDVPVENEKNIANKDSGGKITVFLIDSAGAFAAHIFNPNEWNGESKPIIFSCWSQLSLINYVNEKYKINLAELEVLSAGHKTTILDQWERRKSDWDLTKLNFRAEIPEVHLCLLGHFSAVKTYLDTLVRLLFTENIVNSDVHGFHKKIYEAKKPLEEKSWFN